MAERKQNIGVAALSLVSKVPEKDWHLVPLAAKCCTALLTTAERKKIPRGNFVDEREKCFASRHLVSPPWQPERKKKENDYLFDCAPPLAVDLFIFIRPSLPARNFVHISPFGLCYVRGDLLENCHFSVLFEN